MNVLLPCVMPILLFIGCTREQLKPALQEEPHPPSTSARTRMQIPIFNGAKAFDLLVKQTTFGPRNPGSPGHAACLEFLTAEMKRYTDTLSLQEFSYTGYHGERFQLTNIIGTINPDAAQRVLLCAHWDTRPRADNDEDKSRRDQPILGANDGASGVAVLLELASLLKQSRPSIGVDLMLWDGEDYGREGDLDRYLIGSKYFAAHKPSTYNPRFGILLDMVGDKFLELPREQNSVTYAPDIVELVWRTARELGYPQFIDEAGETITDDHLPLNEVGIKTIDLIDFNYPDPTNRFWHSHNDTPGNCSAESLEAVGTVLTHVVYSQVP